MSEALAAEFADSQPALHAWLTRQIPHDVSEGVPLGSARCARSRTFGSDEPASRTIYEGLAQCYAAIGRAQAAKGTT